MLDSRLVSALRERPQIALVVDGEVLALSIHRVFAADGIELLELPSATPLDIETIGLAALGPEKLAAAYVPSLRKRAAPIACAVSDDNARDVEWQMFIAAYKSVTDVVTRYAWPKLAFHVTGMLARSCGRFAKRSHDCQPRVFDRRVSLFPHRKLRCRHRLRLHDGVPRHR